MVFTTLFYRLPPGDRVRKRHALVNQFLLEEPGQGTGIYASNYRYNVEQYNNYCIFLQRPGWMYKGIDFQVHIEWTDLDLKTHSFAPKHEYIIDVLLYYKSTFPLKYDLINLYIKYIYNCMEVDMENINLLFMDSTPQTHPVQIILLALKWLFMEQDCNYWNYSGRAKLLDFLVAAGLVVF